MAVLDPAPHLHLDALLRPHRSLSRRGLVILLAVIGLYNLLVAGLLFAIGAFPVPVFLGVDFLAVAAAFAVSNARSRSAERVQVTADQVQVRRGPGGREQTVWTSPTAFTRVSVERGDGRQTQVRLRLSNRAMSVGASLGPKERADFAARLEAAIRAARSERYAA